MKPFEQLDLWQQAEVERFMRQPPDVQRLILSTLVDYRWSDDIGTDLSYILDGAAVE